MESTRGRSARALQTTVIESKRLTPQTHGIVLAKPQSFNFRPVQFTFLALMTEDSTDTRPMSLASSPTRPNLEYAVRVSDSPYKRAFTSLRPGDQVTVYGPLGHFVLEEDRPAILIAGGIGITPLKGMAEYASDKRLSIPVRLLYSNRSEDDIAYREELEELETKNPQFQILHTLTGEKIPEGWKGAVGRIDERLVQEATSGLKKPVFYICGKPSMVAAELELLSGLGVPDEDLRIEVFRGYFR